MPSPQPAQEKFDAIVIGTGQAGKPLARALAGAGMKTAVIEKLHVGGTCINVGCTPTKTMVASARVAYLARRAAEYGVHTGPVRVDLGVVRLRKQTVVDSFRDGGRRRLEGSPEIDLIFGTASFVDPKTVEVCLNGGGTRRLTASKIFINAGCRPSLAEIGGLDRLPVLDSSSIMELDVLPDHLLVVGGGYIALEFGQMFRRFGSKVTIVQRGRRLLTREDPDVADAVAEILREDGVEVLFESRGLRATSGADGGVDLTVLSPEGERTLSGSHLLVATGRVPNTEELNLRAASVTIDDRGFIQVNGKLETSAPGIYALGDVKGGPAFTHISYDDFRIIRANLLEGREAKTEGRLVPYTVYIDPQLGRIGMTETEARERGLEVRIAKMPMSWVARAIEMSETRGFMKAVIDAKTNRILGAAVLGVEGGELMSMLQIAMMGNLPYPDLKEAIFAHPTLAESINNLFLALDS